MLRAPASPRAGTKRTRLRRAKASRIGMLWMEITPNAVETPASSRKAATRSPTVAVVVGAVSGKTGYSAGDLEGCAGDVGGGRRGEERDGVRGFLGAAEAPDDDAAVAREARAPLLLALTRLGPGRIARLPLARIDEAEQDCVDA